MAIRAVQINVAAFPQCWHGAPVHIGAPEAIGVDLSKALPETSEIPKGR